MLTPDTNKKLADLKFELSDVGQSKFLLIVCDDDSLGGEILTQLDTELKRARKNARFMGTFQPGKLLQEFYSVTAGTQPHVAFLALQNLSRNNAERVLREINFHRDALIALRVPIVVWLSTELLSALPALAPDFWSRRTAVYRFTQQPTQELLARLFKQQSHLEVPQTLARRAVDEIRKAEKELSKCLRSGRFRVQDADAIIGRVQDNVKSLRNEVQQGNAIDVALYLWSLAELDAKLELLLQGFAATSASTVAEYLYTDRNEGLLFAAQKLPEILEKYLEAVRIRIRQKRRPNLVKTFEDVALHKLADVATDMEKLVGVSTDQLEHILYNSDFHNDDVDRFESDAGASITAETQEPLSTLERSVSAQASYDLESWLTGYNDKRPAVFSENEGHLLKLLYSDERPLNDIARELKTSVRDLRIQIHRLEEKVRFFLSTAEGGGRVSSAEITNTAKRAQKPVPPK